MTEIQNPTTILGRTRDLLSQEEDILFAYLYGSATYDPALMGGDIDIAVFVKSSSMQNYIKMESKLTALLITQLKTDKIDLRILNVLPLVHQYSILKNGILIFSRDEEQRVDFETSVMIRFFELKPYLDEYRLMVSQRIRGT